MSGDESASAAVERAVRAKVGDEPVDAAIRRGTPRTWENAGVLWQVVASGCCEVCDRHDGEMMGLAELEERVMPLGGPVYGCELGGGCGCRALPAG